MVRKRTTSPPKKTQMGRPRVYDDNLLRDAVELVRELGLTDPQLARCFGININTLSNWKRLYPNFLKALKDARWDYDSGNVEKSLLRRALGYEYKETTQEAVDQEQDDGTIARVLRVTKVVTKQMAPDPAAIIFWLCNRQREYWRRDPAPNNTDWEGLKALMDVIRKGPVARETE